MRSDCFQSSLSISGLHSLEDRSVFFLDPVQETLFIENALPCLVQISLVGSQDLCQESASRRVIDDIVEGAVHGEDLIHIPLLCIEVHELALFLEPFYLLIGDPFAGPGHRYLFESLSDRIYIGNVSFGKALGVAAAVRKIIQKSLFLQHPEGLPYRGAAHVQLLSDGTFLYLLTDLILAL